MLTKSNVGSILLQELRRKAAKLIAAKCTLAARVDSCHEAQDGRVELKFTTFIAALLVA